MHKLGSSQSLQYETHGLSVDEDLLKDLKIWMLEIESWYENTWAKKPINVHWYELQHLMRESLEKWKSTTSLKMTNSPNHMLR